VNFNDDLGNLTFDNLFGMVAISGDANSKIKWSLMSLTSNGLYLSVYIGNPFMDLDYERKLKILGIDII